MTADGTESVNARRRAAGITAKPKNQEIHLQARALPSVFYNANADLPTTVVDTINIDLRISIPPETPLREVSILVDRAFYQARAEVEALFS